MKQTVWELLYRTQARQAQQQARRLRAGKAPDWLSAHGVTESCSLVATRRAVPPGVEAMIAADMAAANERAAASRHTRSHGRMPLYAASSCVILAGWLIYDTVRKVAYDVEHGLPWLGGLVKPFFLLLLLAGTGFYVWGVTTAELRLMERLRADWAARLDGRHGTDVLDEVVAWLETRWAWLLPPNLFANDVMWVIGTRRGVPVLVVLERITGTIYRNMAIGAAARTRRNEKVPGGWWTRTNIFLQGAQFRDATHEERVLRTLGRMGGGALQCPSGVYLYAAFGFTRFLRDEGPTSEIWIDLVDQVIDPDFHGSESAAKELRQELEDLGLVTPEGKFHA